MHQTSQKISLSLAVLKDGRYQSADKQYLIVSRHIVRAWHQNYPDNSVSGNDWSVVLAEDILGNVYVVKAQNDCCLSSADVHAFIDTLEP